MLLQAKKIAYVSQIYKFVNNALFFRKVIF